MDKSIKDALRALWPKQYHFIHIPKNGGNSVRDAMGLNVSLSRPLHYRYIDIADEVGRHLTFFCVIRNPWSRTVSRYWFAKQVCVNWPPSDPRRIYIASATFADYVRDQKKFEVPNHPGKFWMGPMSSWFNQLEWIRDETGKVACDCLRLEHLDEDLSAYFGRKFSTHCRNRTKTKAQDYRSMYDDYLIELVAQSFREDIRYFGFSFDGAATRNIISHLPPSLPQRA